VRHRNPPDLPFWHQPGVPYRYLTHPPPSPSTELVSVKRAAQIQRQPAITDDLELRLFQRYSAERCTGTATEEFFSRNHNDAATPPPRW
jgi:hypothetical protein